MNDMLSSLGLSIIDTFTKIKNNNLLITENYKKFFFVKCLELNLYGMV